MNIPELDIRTKNDLITHMKNVSIKYTPEWRFDEDNPDIGTAMAMLYSIMMSDTINRYNRVLELNRVSFFNKIGAKLLPAIPAKGYATFNLVNNEVSGVEVKKGTKLSAEAEEGSVTFETVNDLYVTPASLDHIYLADSKVDRIIQLYNKVEFDETQTPFYIFDTSGKNLQAHEMYFCHDSVLNIEQEAWIGIHISPYRMKDVPKNVSDALLDPTKVSIQYYSEEGYLDFQERRFENGDLLLHKGMKQSRFELTQVEDQESYYIRFIVKDIAPLQGFMIETMTVCSKGKRIEPELINTDGTDQKIKECYPFGEKPSPFSEVYFVSKEALSKKGAMVNFSFHLDFTKVPLEFDQQESPIIWKTIMRRSDFKTDKEYDITIEEVIWEYYNGEGWSRLFVDNTYSKLFNRSNDVYEQKVTIAFECPEDISPFSINSANTYSIRARILKMNNLFKLKGNYVTPIISNPSFEYDYKRYLTPKYMRLRNNLEEKSYTEKDMMNSSLVKEPFLGLKEEHLTMYYGFELPPVEGPIKILFTTMETINEKLPRLDYEYYGNNRWQVLNVVDETETLRKTGVITMSGNYDFTKRVMFGRELYWIRVNDVMKAYHYKKHYKKIPCICGIYINSTQIEAMETMEAERFGIEAKEENKVCSLLNQQVYKTSVWINELKNTTERELKKLEKDYKIRYDFNANGQAEAVWVNWTEVESFSLSGPEDKHYVIDKINGIVSFSDGIHGKIPASGEEETILVEYSCGGGILGNQEPGKIQTMDRSIGYIDRVNNYEITTGGCDQETISEALLRNAAAMKHGYRAVTFSDYEALALEATRNIHSAKCIPNCNSQGEKEYGNVTLVILQKDYFSGRKYFDTIKSQVINYLEPRMSSNLIQLNKFHVVEPRFLEINVNASVVVKEFDQVFDVKSKVLQRMKEFIDPISGNFNHKGWEIGTVPNSTQILNALKEIKDIQFIKNVRISGYVRSAEGMIEVDLDRKDTNRFILPINGKHEVFVEVT